MKIKFYIIIIFSTLLFWGCENEELLSPETVHEEYTVVQGEIQPDKLFPSIRFTKTLPLGVPFNIKQAELKNVTAYLLKNEIQVIPLHYNVDGLYKPLYEFYVEEGETYELIAEVNDKFIYGRTIIPFKPEVSNVQYNTSDYYFDADVKSKLNEVYGALWIIPGNPAARANDYFSVSSPTASANTRVFVRTSSIPEVYRNPAYANNRYMQVYAFDESFRKYFYSRTSGNEINDPFIQTGSKIEWNVQGDKVIGMFIGVAAGEIIKVN